MIEYPAETGRRILAPQVNALAAAPPKSLGNEHAADPESPLARCDEKADKTRRARCGSAAEGRPPLRGTQRQQAGEMPALEADHLEHAAIVAPGSRPGPPRRPGSALPPAAAPCG